MAVYIPTDQNSRLLKRHLMSDFEMKSSHASEAIAALIGFKSHAAFLSSSTSIGGCRVFVADFEAFEARCLELGYEAGSSEWLRFSFMGLDFPHPAWRVISKSDKVARDDWFYDCEQRNVPFMVIIKARKWCTLEWDHISVEPDYDKLVRQAIGEDHGHVLFRLFQLLTFHSSPRAFFDGNALVGTVKNLTEADARIVGNAFAERIFPGNLETLVDKAA
ncbi:MAG: hypothetical protein QNI87_06825 [Erythrobacter sp.]|uniref:hypothetical protein n=1 Tax=Erythrobacter sp. TaxID=1042 RepID=UPI002632A3ED|nr:hypothetical protein [Erythrobacter sp.]MDJ0978231.1 hypothetical protein [Erythrobacter sp.]